MHKLLNLVFLSVCFVACFASNVALCDGEDFDPYVVLVGAERTKVLATGPCEGKQQGDPCKDTGYAKGICSLEKASANAQAQLTCKAMECVDGRYLWIAENGTQMGRCHLYNYIQTEVCDKHAEQCINGNKFTPNIKSNPNKGYDGLAYQGCLCQPDCESVYGLDTESYKCCRLGAVWDDANNTCDCTKVREDLIWNGETCKIKTPDVTRLTQRQPEIISPQTEVDKKSRTRKISCDADKNLKAKANNKECECISDEYEPVYSETGFLLECTTKQVTGDCETKYAGKANAIKCCKQGAVWDDTNNTCDCTNVREDLIWNGETCKIQTPDVDHIDPEQPQQLPDPEPEIQKRDCDKTKHLVFDIDSDQCICQNRFPIEKRNKGVLVQCDPCPSDTKFDDESGQCVCNDEDYIFRNEKCIKDPQKEYDKAKEKEQSLANRSLTAATTLATGLGAMQLAQGLSEQKADKNAEADMAAYLATFRCTYGDGKSVKGGMEPVELPGGNDSQMMKLRSEYFTLAASLKERKESLGMKPGIESEDILDKAQMGLYDDENTGISGGNYASLYRAQMGSTEDQSKIDADKNKSDKRVKIGATVAGIGVVGGVLGNSIINGKLGEMIKDAKSSKESKKKESEALDKLKKCLKSGGAKNTDKLSFTKFTPSVLYLDNIDCSGAEWKDKVRSKDATKLFIDSDDAEKINKKLVDSFGEEMTQTLLGVITGEAE